MANVYTQKMFYEDVIALITGDADIGDLPTDEMIEKAEKGIEQLEKRAEYAKTHPSKAKTAAKGPSEETLARAAAIKGVLTNKPKTIVEINEALGTDLNALQISGVMKFIENVQKTKVVRNVTDKKGLKAERMYTAYFVE
jgi:hypothetical protein